ncbi:MAG TPA: hypothetical protein VK399_02635 [Longimicrobiaceae bacterium]|nr:hypothetical protein [Longimicrobiaceae bacterium]
MHRPSPCVLLLLAALCACSEDRGSGSSFAARDSAGIRIAENGAGTGAAWTVSAAPTVEIGTFEGEPAYQLYQAVSAARLGDGRIVVANGGTKEVRYYGPDGRHLKSVGGDGEGPGEFRSIHWVGALPGDSVAAWDPIQKRITVLDPRGGVARMSKTTAIPGMVPQVRGVLADGSLVLTSGFNTAAMMGERGVRRDTATYLRVGRDGSVRDTLGRFPGMENYVDMNKEGGSTNFTVRQLPFGRQAVAAGGGERLYVGTGEAGYEVRVYRADGALERIVRRAHQPLPVTPEDIAEYKRTLVTYGLDANARRQYDRSLDAMPYPATMPPYVDMLVDAGGSLWVEDARRPADPQPSWTVFDAEGKVLATVRLPDRLNLQAAGPDWVLGTFRDDDEIEHVRVYGLRRG